MTKWTKRGPEFWTAIIDGTAMQIRFKPDAYVCQYKVGTVDGRHVGAAGSLVSAKQVAEDYLQRLTPKLTPTRDKIRPTF